ncbi:MAG: alpha-galactosidase [Kiritimatiellae bacterium]|nr:alpha-galactosidase [Kiritimatiellia bacterium]
MAVSFEINVILRSGKQVLFDGIAPGAPYAREKEGVKLAVGADCPAPVTATPAAPADPIASIEYNLYTDIRNYHKVIIPESGRWYINMTQMVSFWRFQKDSAINDVKVPLYIFTGQDLNTAMAFGVIGRNYETAFKTLEPKVNRALIVYMRRLSMQIKRGTDLYPIPDSIAKAAPDGAVTEHLYFRTDRDAPNRPWLLTLREFAEHQKRLYALPDVSSEAAMAPLWCSWTDWFSDDVTDAVIVRSVREGVKLGIRNYIIDDGWFGPGLDNDFDVTLNIGDWRPDPAKIKDMNQLVRDVRAAGGVPIIWCAPHAVAPGAGCFAARRPYLIVGEDGERLMTPNKFHSLCFMCPEAREIMADICASFIEEWDFDGAKYDLFNCVPNMRCCSTDHSHDVSSMMEGLELTLKRMAEKCRALKPDYIIELKQNYGTPFLAQYGSMTRAGDTPYNTEGNFLRTVYVQGYSPYSINDYQTVTNEDSPEATACVVIKMMAAGIPTYSIDFDRLCPENKAVIGRYNAWYNENLRAFMHYRVPLDGENNVWKLESEQADFFFLVNDGGHIPLARSAVVLNGTFKRDLFVQVDGRRKGTVIAWDCRGTETARRETDFDGWTHLDVPPGGMVRIEL